MPHPPGILPHRRLRLFQCMEDDLGFQGQRHPCYAFLFLSQQVACVVVLHDGNQLHQERRKKDEEQAGALPFLEISTDPLDERVHGRQDSKKRKESRIRKIMST